MLSAASGSNPNFASLPDASGPINGKLSRPIERKVQAIALSKVLKCKYEFDPSMRKKL